MAFPRESVEIARRAIEAFNRIDVDAFAALTTPDFEWSPSIMAIEGEIFLGHEGIEKYFASLGNASEDFHMFVTSSAITPTS